MAQTPLPVALAFHELSGTELVDACLRELSPLFSPPPTPRLAARERAGLVCLHGLAVLCAAFFCTDALQAVCLDAALALLVVALRAALFPRRQLLRGLSLGAAVQWERRARQSLALVLVACAALAVYGVLLAVRLPRGTIALLWQALSLGCAWVIRHGGALASLHETG